MCVFECNIFYWISKKLKVLMYKEGIYAIIENRNNINIIIKDYYYGE
jgi:sulfur transfer complex TusBCD TusB component (DsrH family)